ncbi:MAG TPA: hypothetical protein VLZ75_04395 [Chitinophagales bacterium]|nr:hypothetical protein [Chitinophagales bacterium]
MEIIAFKQTLVQSEFAGDFYKEMFEQENTTFANPLIEEVEEIYNQITNDYDTLTQWQISVLSEIINQLNKVRLIIDPHRLKSFKHSLNDDGDLLLFRESEKGLVNIILHPENDFAFSFIGNQKGNLLEFYTIDGCDFESIVLNFLS